MSLGSHTDEDFCYLTTTGRLTGQPREIEIWFALRDTTLYMLSGNRDDSSWVKNIQRNPTVSVRIGATSFPGTARILPEGDEDKLARRLLVEKYQPGYRGDLTEWGQTALPVAIDVDVTPT